MGKIYCCEHPINTNDFQKKEWERYHDLKPSIFQRICWIFWATQTSIKWQMYKDITVEEIKA